jgi:hypothetical protein
MSDFLSRLAGRALGVEPVVQPVIPAMAAPASREETFKEGEGFPEAVHDSPVIERAADPRAVGLNRSEPAPSQTPASPHQHIRERETVSATDVRATRMADQPLHEPRVSEPLADTPDEADGLDRTIPAATNSYLQPSAIAPHALIADRREVASSAPPIVRVTIGRIEVRAELPSPKDRTPAAPRPKNSAISLDDYLKKRTEGRR